VSDRGVLASHDALAQKNYFSFGGDTMGMRVDGELSWIFSDQLGSTGITYQADGSATARQFYYPFGGIRNPGGAPVVDTDVGFTGQRLDETTGLMFYQARYYDPVTVRFISADTMIPDPGNAQDFNRYSYVRNNPLGYTDPSGNEPDDTYACPGSLYECTSDGMTFSTGLWSDVGDTAPFQDSFFPEPRKWWNIVISNAVRAVVDFIPVSANAVLSAAYWADDVVRAQRKPVVSDGLVYYDGLPPMQRSYFPTIGMDQPERGLYATAPYVLTQVGLAVWAGKVLGGSRASRLANVSDDAASGLRFRPNTSHIFRDAAGHFAQDTPANRALMINAVRRQNLISERSIGARTLFRYAQDLPDGRQVWAEVLDNVITNGGINGVGR
jgi:RHS repeat-associated protein